MTAEARKVGVPTVALATVLILAALSIGGAVAAPTVSLSADNSTNSTPEVSVTTQTTSSGFTQASRDDRNRLVVPTTRPASGDQNDSDDDTPKRGDNSTTESTTVVRTDAGAGTLADTTDNGDSTNTIQETFLLNRTPSTKGSVQFTYQFEPSESLTNYTVSLAQGQTVLTSENFTQVDDGEWYWDGSTADGTLVVRADANRSGTFGRESVDVGEWAFVGWRSFQTGGYSFWYSGEYPSHQRVFQLEGDGVLSSENGYAYLGNYTQTTYDGLVEFRFVDPESAQQASDKHQVMKRLDAIARQFDIGERESPIYVFGPGDPIRRGGQASEDEIWSHANSGLTDVTDGSTWYEEYVHTRQAFADSDGVYGTDMYWIVEGTGTYYRNYVAYRFGDISASQLYDDVYAFTDKSVVLTDVRSQNPGPAYSKGAHVAMALDLKIRNVTDGTKTLESVMRRLNTKAETSGEDQITFSQFKSLTEDEIGVSLDSWLETYVNSSALPSIPQNPAGAWDTTSGVPVAEAGANLTVGEGETVTLDAHDSRDPNFEALTYSWKQTDGPNASIADARTARPTLTAPQVDSNRTLTLQLSVSDDDGNSDTDTVTVDVVDTTSISRDWSVESGGRTQHATPAVGPDRIFVAGLDATVTAVYRSNGSVSWTVERNGSLSDSAPTYNEGIVYVGGGGGTVYALDATTGDIEWRFENDSAVTSSPIVVGSGPDATVYVGANDGAVYALNATDGTLRWSTTVDAAIYGTPAFHAETDSLFVPTSENRLLVLNGSDGSERWRLRTDADLGHLSPVVAEGDLFFAADKVYRIDPGQTTEETDILWTTDLNTTSGSTPTVDSGTVYVGRSDGTVMTLNASANGNGTVEWSKDVGAELSGKPAVDDGQVLLGDHDGIIHVLDAGSGGELASVAMDALIRGALALDGDDIYVADRSGTVVRLTTVDEQLGNWIPALPQRVSLVTSASG